MTLLFLIMVQAGNPTPPDGAALTVPPRCVAERSAGDEIVVCANRQEELNPYRINRSPARQPEIPKAEVQIANGVSASADTEQADVGGFPSNRAMVRLKIKF